MGAVRDRNGYETAAINRLTPAVERTPSVLLVGHSFVRRLRDHASKRGQTLAEVVGIKEVASVHTIYAGGATFERALHPSTSLVVRLRDLKELPEIMCIDLGTNDLCAVGATVSVLVASAIELLDSLRRAHLMPKHLVFMGVVQRTAAGCRRGVSAASPPRPSTAEQERLTARWRRRCAPSTASTPAVSLG